MKIIIPKKLAEIQLGEYHPELAGKVTIVWLNPPRTVLQERVRMQKAAYNAIERSMSTLRTEGEDKANVDQLLDSIETAKDEVNGWYAQIWSQGPDADTHWTVEEIRQTLEESPNFLTWLIERTNALLDQTASAEKKA